ncbi:MAG: sugar ABC transporter substrate-binding protein [Cyanobacteria bacterium P01_G01_bin.54]
MLSNDYPAQLKITLRQYRQFVYRQGRLFLLSLFLIATLAACLAAPENSSQPLVSPRPTQPTDETESLVAQIATLPEVKASQPWQIVFASKSPVGDDGKIIDPNWENIWQAIQAAAIDFGVTVTLVDSPCQTCAHEQIQTINDLLARSPQINGLLIGVNDSWALAPVVDKVIGEGIPTIAIDTPLNSNLLLTTIGFDNFAGGQRMGEWVVEKLHGQGQVAILNGPLDQQNAIDRQHGFLRGLQQGQDIKILAVEEANWHQNNAQKITAKWLKQYPELDAIIAANDYMALGASDAAATAQIPLLITGFDATDFALDAIQKGQFAATISQKFSQQGRLALQLLVRHLENQETLPPLIPLTNTQIITQADL